MLEKQGFYSIIQYSPVSDRFEFVNIGVVLVAPDRKFVGVRFSKGARRIEKFFGKQKQGAYLAYLKQSIADRLKVELSRDLSRSHFEGFVASRANDIRFSKPLPMLVEDPDADLDELFESLVGDVEIAQRGPKVITKFRKQLEAAGVSHLLQKPEPVSLPKCAKRK